MKLHPTDEPTPRSFDLAPCTAAIDAALDAVEAVLGRHPGRHVKTALRLLSLARTVNEHELRHVLELEEAAASELFDTLRRSKVVATSDAGLTLHPIVRAAFQADVLMRDPFAARHLVDRMLAPVEAALAWPGTPRDRALAQLDALLAAAPGEAVDPPRSSLGLSTVLRAWALREPRAESWMVAADGTSARLPDGSTLDLRRRRAARRILAALARLHTEQPGTPLSAEQCIDAGWPDERMSWTSAQNRLWTAIRTLRALGLEPVIETMSGGYRLASTVRVA